MWQTLLINLKLHLREKTQLFWLFAFPIILATMFNGMFGNIAESFELHTLDVAVVEDNAWKTSYGAQTLIEGISSESSALSDNHVKVSADGKNGTGLINTTKVESIAQAEQLWPTAPRKACCESMTADCDSPSHSRRNRPCPM